jgi:hypothetical protein
MSAFLPAPSISVVLSLSTTIRLQRPSSCSVTFSSFSPSSSAIARTLPAVSLTQIRANRLNAQGSTGPVTPGGKATVAQNALKHGLLARATLLPGDSPAAARALTTLSASLRTELKPEGPVQHALMDRIVANLWRLRRLAQVESGLFASRLYDDRAGPSLMASMPFWVNRIRLM